MHRDEIPITTPCGADWSEMSVTDARARLCASCNKIVHDISAMKEAEVRSALSAGPACVRYLYDANGRVLLGGAPPGATIVSAGSLLSKVARNKWVRAAAVAASAVVFEACGGNDGGRGYVPTVMIDGGAGDDSDGGDPREPADAAVHPDDAGDAGDAGTDRDASADAADSAPDGDGG